MFRDGFSFVMCKYFSDAQQQLAEHEQRKVVCQRRRAELERRYRLLKRSLLAVALAGVAHALYYAHDLGGLVASNLTSATLPDPSLQAPPKSTAKRSRKLAEVRRQREEDLNEIEKF